MTLHGAYSPRPGLELPEPAASDHADPFRAFEAALRVARAATHERKLDPPTARAFAAFIEAADAAKDAFRSLDARLRRIEGRFFGDP